MRWFLRRLPSPRHYDHGYIAEPMDRRFRGLDGIKEDTAATEAVADQLSETLGNHLDRVALFCGQEIRGMTPEFLQTGSAYNKRL